MKYLLKINEYLMNYNILKNLSKNHLLLFHGLKPKFAKIALDNNELVGHSLQKIWKNWNRYQDNHPDYDKSDYLRGISTTRDIDYAEKFGGGIIFVFDKNKIQNNYKILPYNWKYNISDQELQNKLKDEREDFVITGFNQNYLLNKETGNLYNDEETVFNKYIDMINEPKGILKPLNKYMIGFFITEKAAKTLDKNMLNELMNNKLYLGIYK